MTKTEFIQAATEQYSVTETEPFFNDIDLMADRALSLHLGEIPWNRVRVTDQHYLLLIMGSMIHFSRASKSAKMDFPVESMEGRVDKSAIYRNNIGMALALRDEYQNSLAQSGAGVRITNIGRLDPISTMIFPLDTVPVPETAVIVSVTADNKYMYVDWEDSGIDWGYRRSVVYYGEEDPYDPYEYGQIRAGSKAGMYVYDAEIHRSRFPVPPNGDYLVRVARENLNGVISMSEPYVITITGSAATGAPVV